MGRAYLCVSVIGTGDRDRDGRPRQPPSFAGRADGVATRIHPFFERFGARPTYLVSADVLRDPGSLTLLRRLSGSAELGTHVERPRGDGDERAALTEVTDLFIRAFGHQPQSFRGAADGPGPASLGIVESLGYEVDASVTPFVGRATHAPTQPYRPDPDEPARPGHASIVEVPITIRRHPLHVVPVIGRRTGPRWLRPGAVGAEALVRVAEDELAAARRTDAARPVILHAVMSGVEVVPGAGLRAANEEEARRPLDGLRALLTFARRAGIPVVGLADVPEILA
jgi:hypothetical protein